MTTGKISRRASAGSRLPCNIKRGDGDIGKRKGKVRDEDSPPEGMRRSQVNEDRGKMGGKEGRAEKSRTRGAADAKLGGERPKGGVASKGQ